MFRKILILFVILAFTSCVVDKTTEYHFLNTTYSTIGGLKSDEHISSESLKEYDFFYCMAAPSWKSEDFDRSQEEIDSIYVENFNYKTLYGNDYILHYICNIHENGGKILCCFPGSDIIEIATIPDRRRKFSTMVARFIAKFGYDGVDIDWEQTIIPSLHVVLMEEIRKELDNLRLSKKLYLTTALHTYVRFSLEEAEKLCRNVDWINLMFYDMGGGIWGDVPTHNSPLNIMERHFNEYWSYFPVNKLCIGLASYGFRYHGIKPAKHVDAGKSLKDYGSYCKYILPQLISEGWVERQDTIAKCSYYFSPDSLEFVTLETKQSLDAKLKWIASKGINKVFWWEFYSDWVSPSKPGSRGEHLIMDYVSRKLGKLDD